MRVLLVEDEENISQPLARLLEKNGVASDIVADGVSGLMQAEKNIYDVLVLDVLLPEMDGFEIVRRVRSAGLHVPILMLTARDGVEDKISGLNLGADDYLAKPFHPMEVVARIKALARRKGDPILAGTLEFADIRLEPSSATVTLAGTHRETLTAKETGILEALMRVPGAIVSKEHLLDNVWGLDSEAGVNTVEIYMHYLRKKLEKSKMARIVTVRGLGYALKESLRDDD